MPKNFRHTSQTKHPAIAMVFGLIVSGGKKMPTVFFPCGLKITADAYLDVLKKKVLP